MNYKIKITETVGSASIVTEVETDDLSFAKLLVTEKEATQDVNVNNNHNKENLKEFFNSWEAAKDRVLKTSDLGGVENWMFKPTDLTYVLEKTNG